MLNRQIRSIACVGAALLVLGTIPAVAQKLGPAAGCEATPDKAAPTPAKQGGSSGTDPGNAGSTGWSGGTGGSNIGTTPGSPTPGSPTEHPATVQGVNPSVVGPTRKDC